MHFKGAQKFCSSSNRLNRSMWVFRYLLWCIHTYFSCLLWSWDLIRNQQWHQEPRFEHESLGLKIWVFWIWAWFYEIGWLSMLKCCWIEDWLDQFQENMFGIIFPNIFILVEWSNALMSWIFWILVYWMCWKSFGDIDLMLNWI